MLYELVRPVLFRLDAERAHEVGLAAAHRLAQRPSLARRIRASVARPVDTPVELAGLTFPNRIGLAAGLDKNGLASLAWWAFGFGFAELGTVTPKPQDGNPRPRMFRIRERSAIVNRMGFNNLGAEALVRRLEQQSQAGLRPPMPLGISVGKNATTPLENAADDYAAAASIVLPQADFITVNVSSPNTAGLRSLQTSHALRGLLSAVRSAIAKKPLFVKLAPELEGNLLDEVLDTCLDVGIEGLIATNTLATKDGDGLPNGGLSGRPLRELALDRVAAVRKRVGDGCCVIGCGGIDDVASASAMLNAGADLLQIYTGLVYQGPYLPARISRGLASRSASAQV